MPYQRLVFLFWRLFGFLGGGRRGKKGGPTRRRHGDGSLQSAPPDRMLRAIRTKYLWSLGRAVRSTQERRSLYQSKNSKNSRILELIRALFVIVEQSGRR